ncbi:MAG: Ig-like domain-containing protein [Elusimicrobia bacterium]|nr:Ig-like domain-containing protein [Elusimicrobiota bacterium]
MSRLKKTLAVVLCVATLHALGPRPSGAYISTVGAPAQPGMPTVWTLCAANPVACGVAAAVIAGLVVVSRIGGGREAADDFVQEVQNPFGHVLALVLDAFNAGVESGRMTREQAMQAKQAVELLWASFDGEANEFASRGGNQRRVVEQAHRTLDPLIARILADMDGAIASLPSAALEACARRETSAFVLGIGSAIEEWIRAAGGFDRHGRLVDRFVHELQNPFGAVLAKVVGDFNAAVAAGTVSREDAQLSRSMVDILWRDFDREASRFASESRDRERRRQIVRQARQTLDPLIARIRADMDAALASLKLASLQVEFVRPEADATLSRRAPLEATVACGEAERVEFFLDGQSIGVNARDGLTRWGLEWDTRRVPNGPHELVARATAGERMGERRIRVVVANEASPNGKAPRHRFTGIRSGGRREGSGWRVQDFGIAIVNPSDRPLTVTWTMTADDPGYRFTDGRAGSWSRTATLPPVSGLVDNIYSGYNTGSTYPVAYQTWFTGTIEYSADRPFYVYSPLAFTTPAAADADHKAAYKKAWAAWRGSIPLVDDDETGTLLGLYTNYWRNHDEWHSGWHTALTASNSTGEARRVRLRHRPNYFAIYGAGCAREDRKREDEATLEVPANGRVSRPLERIFDWNEATRSEMEGILLAEPPAGVELELEVRPGPPGSPVCHRAPAVRLVSPQDGARVRGAVELRAAVTNGSSPVDEVEFLVDGASVARSSAPFSASWDSSSASEGRHRVVARAIDVGGEAVEAAATVTVVGGSTSTLRIPDVPAVRPPATIDPGLRAWLEGWAKYIGGRGDASRGEPNANPCGVRWGDEPQCRIQADGRWYTYPIAPFYPFVENVFWQLAARGEVRGSSRPDFVQTEGPTVYAYGVAVATLLKANNLPVAGAIGPLTSHLRAWPATTDFDPAASQDEILRSRAFQQALDRQFFHQHPQYASLRELPLMRWPASALRAREHVLVDLYRMLASRNFDEPRYLAMVAEDVGAGRLPAGFSSFLASAPATKHGPCDPAGACTYRSFPFGTELLCMDVGNTGRFSLQPIDQQPACGTSNLGQVAVFPRACGWNPAVCTGAAGAWKYLHEVNGALAGQPEVLRRVSEALDRQGFALERYTPETRGDPGSIPLAVRVTRPPSGARLSGVVAFEISVVGGARLRRVQLLANGRLVGGVETPPSSTFVREVDTRSVPDGEYPIVVRATDMAGSTAQAELRAMISNGRERGEDELALAAKLLEVLGGTAGAPAETAAQAGGSCAEDGPCFAEGSPRLVCMKDWDGDWKWQPETEQPPCAPDPGSRCRIARFASACPAPWGPARCYPGPDPRNRADNRVGHWRFLAEDPPSPDPCADEPGVASPR